MNTAPLALTQHFAALAPHYDVVLSDVWGVVHNGLAAWPEACAALKRFREGGGTVVLISNAPRPGEHVKKFLDHAQSAARHLRRHRDLRRRDRARSSQAGRARPMHHLGPSAISASSRDWIRASRRSRTPTYVVCTGLLNDEVETPDDYRARLEQMRARNLLMVCGNPDLVVERGDKLVYCAGAIADLYGEMGGEVHLCRQAVSADLRSGAGDGGEAARQRAAARRACWRSAIPCAPISRARSMPGIDCLFVTAGHSRRGTRRPRRPDLGTLAKMFDDAKLAPKAVTRRGEASYPSPQGRVVRAKRGRWTHNIAAMSHRLTPRRSPTLPASGG